MTETTLMQLVRKLRSPDVKLALEAVEQLRVRGWLGDGLLSWTDLSYVHLPGADLCEANLKGANLSMADLERANFSMANLEAADLRGANLRETDLSRANLLGADLYKADLSGARNLGDAQLSQAERLRDAIMPDGTPYDGRYNRAGDTQALHTKKV
jgi:uncharacterized protein YjbI with pentapeptide repeats